jgi:hypothetical protein
VPGSDGSAESSRIASAHKAGMRFEDLWRRVLLEFAEPSRIPSDGTPVLLRDRPKLCTACAKLTAEMGNKELDLVTQRWIQGMMGLLNLYLDEGLNLSWRKTSVLVSKAQGCGNTHARRIREWTLQFLQTKALPLHRLGQVQWTVLSNEDIASEIKLRMVKKSKKGVHEG